MKNRKNTKETIVNYDTGEIIGHIIYPVYKKYLKEEEWFIAMQEGLDYITQLKTEKKLNGQDVTVFLKLLTIMDFENNIFIKQTELCEKLKIHKSNMTTSFRKLLNERIIYKGEDIGMNGKYVLDPFFGYKGKIKNLLLLERKIYNLNVKKT